MTTEVVDSSVPADAAGPLVANQLFRRALDRAFVRVVHVDRPAGRCVLFDVGRVEALPEVVSYDRVLEQVALRELMLAEHDPFVATEKFDLLSEARQSYARRRYQKIRPLLELGPFLFHPDRRGAAISELAKSRRCARASAYALLRLWWSRGMTLAALVTEHDRCGVSSKPRKDPVRKPGPPRTIRPGVGVSVTQAMKAHFAAAMRPNEHGVQVTPAQGYARYLKEHHAADCGITRNGIDPRPGTEDRIPTLEQFKYHVVDSFEPLIRRASRRLRRMVGSKLRPFLDSARRHALYPGSRYEIDATILDVYLVSRFDRNRIVGRPTLYVVVDVFSGMIVGLALSLNPPSWVSATKAIVNCLEDKVALCADVGLTIPATLWPTAGMAGMLVGDNGEAQSRLSTALLAATNTTLANTKAYFPEGKGTVESGFKTLQAPMGEFVDGYVCKDYQPRTDPDYRFDATLTLPEAFALIASSALKRNLTPRTHRSVDPELNAAGVPAIPLELWQYGVEKLGCAARAFEPDSTRIQLLPHRNVVATERGLHLARGLYYGSIGLMEKPWFLEAFARKQPVAAIWNPELSTYLYVPDPTNPRDIFAAELTPHCSKFRELTFVEIDAMRKRQSKLDAEGAHRHVFDVAALDDFQLTVVENARAATKAQRDPRMSNTNRIANIRDNRAAETAVETVAGAYRPPLARATPEGAQDTAATNPQAGRLAERSARRHKRISQG